MNNLENCVSNLEVKIASRSIDVTEASVRGKK